MKKDDMIPAVTGERIQYVAHDFNDNTIRFVLHYKGTVNADMLCSAIGAVISGADILHASFIPGNFSSHWLINTEYETADYFTHIKESTNTMEAAITASLNPIALTAKTQLHCTLLEGDSDFALAIRISHFCADGVDGKYLLYKIFEAYNLLSQKGNTNELNIKNGSRAPEQIYEELSHKEYLSLMRNPISKVKSCFPFPTDESGTLHMVKKHIPASVMIAAHDRAKTEHATINDILLTACYRAYASLPEVDASSPMSIMSMMDLRQHCKTNTSMGLCNMSGTLPTMLEHGIANTFHDTLAQVVIQTKAIKENPLAGMEGMPLLHSATRTLPMWLILQIGAKVYGSFSIGLTNLGNISCDTLALDGLLPDDGIFGGPLKKKPAMQISAASFDGTTALAVVGEYTDADAALLQKMLDHIAKEIQEYATTNGCEN